MHGFLPGTAHELAGHVLGRDWRAIHLGTILALLLWVFAFTAVGSLITTGPGALLARFAQLAEASAHGGHADRAQAMAGLDLLFRAVVGSTTMLVQLWVLGLGIAWWRQSLGSVTGRQSTGVDRTIALEVSP
ncbi:hypothetical protein M8C13_16800 [Crossiella sp. SN42]|uniref:hypothetical protein n=1 Tax=Crossiella sp. SN42 TaxID=2944808 RepID=UPI00207C8F6A|nr:hypothetical protein [Crossiella sp. SN42]MCO1577417.1 hypothetical protein [Crossiella sp. SN42]